MFVIKRIGIMNTNLNELYLCMGMPLNKRGFVMLLAAIYLFVSLTHIVFVQHSQVYQHKISFRYNSIFKRQNSDGLASPKLSSLKRTDKTKPAEHQDAVQLISRYAQLSLILFGFGLFVSAVQKKARHYYVNYSSVHLPLLCCFKI
jgi:hypothetical protein